MLLRPAPGPRDAEHGRGILAENRIGPGKAPCGSCSSSCLSPSPRARARPRRRGPPPCCSSRSTRCAPTAWGPTATRPRARRSSTRSRATGVLFERGLLARAAHAAGARHDPDRPAAAGARRARQRRRSRSAPAPRTLAEALKRRGLATAAFVGAFPLARRFGLARGFDVYDDAFERAPGLHFDFPERRADRVVDAALALARGAAGPGLPVGPPLRPARALRSAGRLPRRRPLSRARSPSPTRSSAGLLAGLGRAARPLRGRASRPITARPSASTARRATACSSTTRRCACRCCCAGTGRPAAGRVRDARSASRTSPRRSPTSPAPQRCPGASLARFAQRDVSRGGGPLYAETLAPRLDFGWSELRSLARRARYKYVRAPRPELYDVEADPGESARPRGRDAGGRATRLAAALDAALHGWATTESRRAPGSRGGRAAARARLRPGPERPRLGRRSQGPRGGGAA